MQPPNRTRFTVKPVQSLVLWLNSSPPGSAGLEELCDVGSAAVVTPSSAAKGGGCGGVWVCDSDACALIFLCHLITWQVRARDAKHEIRDPPLDSFQPHVRWGSSVHGHGDRQTDYT